MSGILTVGAKYFNQGSVITLIPYCKIFIGVPNTEISHSEYKKDGTVVVHCETKTDSMSKVLDCVLPSYDVKNIMGYSDYEKEFLMDTIRHNAAMLITCAKAGGWKNV